MERAWLEARLAEGRSIESIAKEVGKHPSTVAYWVKKHRLRSPHADRHAARGALDRDSLVRLVEQGLSSRQIAQEVGRSQATVRHWLKQHGLRTQKTRSEGPQPDEVLRVCPTHGEAVFVRYGETDHYRCLRCRRDRVIARRRKVKEILVAEAGGCCAVCGYATYTGALQFHHRDPTTKRFGLALNGSRALDCPRSRGGSEVRPPLRELPRGGRGRRDWATLVAVAGLQHRSMHYIPG